MEKTGTVVIGAGVVGLAIAAELSRTDPDLILVEQEDSFGRVTSSRSSEVIHAGIYYPPGSLKARLCVEGRALLYERAERDGIPARRIGKWIVTRTRDEEGDLAALLERGRANGVADLDLVPARRLAEAAPLLRGTAALSSPSTGIVDSHTLMRRLELCAREQGATVSYTTRVAGICRAHGGYVLEIVDADGQPLQLAADVVINAAGLDADRLAGTAGIDISRAGYTVDFIKCEFYRAANPAALPREMLVYPVEGFSVGIHTVMDMQGGVKLGPKAYPTGRKLDYSVDDSLRGVFFSSCAPLFPLLKQEDLSPDMAGIYAAIADGSDEFVIRHETDRGLPGLVNLIGMKSPALTACLAIARYVRGLLS